MYEDVKRAFRSLIKALGYDPEQVTEVSVRVGRYGDLSVRIGYHVRRNGVYDVTEGVHIERPR